jgi:hypothetical protein
MTEYPFGDIFPGMMATQEEDLSIEDNKEDNKEEEEDLSVEDDNEEEDIVDEDEDEEIEVTDDVNEVKASKKPRKTSDKPRKTPNRVFNDEDAAYVYANFKNMTNQQLADARGLTTNQVHRIITSIKKHLREQVAGDPVKEDKVEKLISENLTRENQKIGGGSVKSTIEKISMNIIKSLIKQ